MRPAPAGTAKESLRIKVFDGSFIFFPPDDFPEVFFGAFALAIKFISFLL
jgi:hypothetical protein